MRRFLSFLDAGAETRPSLPRHALAGLVSALVFSLSCAPADLTSEDLVGDWRAVLASPGGELPFTLRVEDGGGWLRAVILNGEEQAPTSSVTLSGRQAIFAFDWYDAEITTELEPDGRLVGRWRKTAAEGDSALDFTAEKGDTARFRASTDAPRPGVDDVSGVWSVEFTDDSGSEPARGEMTQVGARVTGTFLTPTGDYRFLEGRFDNGLLRLSTFDGAHAFLFHARAQSDGSLEGDFWSRDVYHATWTAQRLESPDSQTLPDAWQLVGLTNDEGRFSWEFPDLDGKLLSSSDSRFRNKVVMVNIFGTWCPNCNDEAPLLSAWHRRYRDQGLEIVGLAYEMTGDVDRDRKQVERFAERYSISYPLLLAGTSDKQEAATTVPDLTGIVAYPTTIFVDRAGLVRRVHSGFAGPGTGSHHSALVNELEGLIRELLAEAPGL